MKKLYLYIIGITITLTVHAQTGLKDFIGLTLTDLNQQEGILGTTEIATVNGVSVQQLKATSPSEVQPHLSNIHTIDKTKDIGEIPFNSSVDATGNFNIKVPINLYQNPKGFTPEVSLVFNSSSTRPGAVGAGWNIGGLSSINRVNKNIYYDGFVEGVGLTSPAQVGYDNTFTLDGLRLIYTGATIGARIYTTEQGNIKVLAYTFTNMNIPRYFEVYYPDGRKAIYGDKLDMHTYPLMEVTDKAGNTIKYTYDKVNYNFRLSKITYGESEKISVEFTNTEISEPMSIFYRSGDKIPSDYRLTQITTKLNEKVLFTYDIDYLYRGYTYVIQKINCSASGKSINPLIFEYTENNSRWQYEKEEKQLSKWLSFSDPDNIRVTKGKFNYGGENDGVIMVANKVHYMEYKKGNNNYVDNKYTGEEDIAIVPDLGGELSMETVVIKTGKGFVDIFCADIDDFPEEEIIKVNNYVSGDNDRVEFHVYGYDIVNGIVQQYTRTFDFNTLLEHNGKKSINPKFYYTGDFTGRGKTEVLVVSAYNIMGKNKSTMCYLIDLQNNKLLYDGSPFKLFTKLPKEGDSTIGGQEAYNDSYKLYPIDYNGDGKTDICMIDDSGTHIYSFYQSSTDRYYINNVSKATTFYNTLLKDKELYIGEFNGDGKTDFLLSPKAGETTSTWNIYLSQGDGSFDRSDITIRSRKDIQQTIIQDINNDGLTDVLFRTSNNGSESIATYFIRDNKVFTTMYSPILPEKGKLIPTNLHSTNYYNKLLCLHDKGKMTSVNFMSDSSKERMVSRIVSSTGVVTKIAYEQLNRYDGYKKGEDAKFPYCNYKGGHIVVTDIATYVEGEPTSHLSYEYENAILHKEGLGFRGFKKVKFKNTLTEDYCYQTYTPYEYSVLVEEENRLSKNTYTYNHNLRGDKIRLSTLTKKVSSDKLTGVSVTTGYTYDSYGNPLTETIDYGNNLKTVNSNSYTNIDAGTEYRLGLLTSQQTVEYYGATTNVQRKSFTYNGNYLPLSIRTSSAVSSYTISTEEFGYDDNSNLITAKKKPYVSSQWQTEKYTYDDLGRIISKMSPLNHSTQYVYNIAGLVSKMTDHKGNATNYTYDVWGRPKTVAEPYGSVKNMSYQWNNSTLENALYIYTQTETLTPTLKVYYDALGRAIRESTLRFDGKYLHTDKIYDIKGRLQQESLPYKDEYTPVWNTYQYDTYDRLTSLKYSSGKTDAYSYSGLSVTTKIDQITTTRTYNNRGWITKVVDPGGTITYDYFPDGRIKSIIAPGNHTTTFTYDIYLRKTSITDPSAGKRTYTYDAAGNINKETDAKGNITTMTYDNYNRLIKKVVGNDLTTTYSYNSDGMLTGKTGSNGTSTTYTYDKYLRVLTKTEKIDNYSFRKTYTYNYKKISMLRYAQIKVGVNELGYENYKYSNGHLTEIIYYKPSTVGTTTSYTPTSIWKLSEEKEMGLATKVLFGGMERNFLYTSHGYLQTRNVKYNDKIIRSIITGYNTQTGNVASKWESDPLYIEAYSYDELNRLTKYKNTEVTYDEKGNITKKADVGSFGYNNVNSPYSITTANPVNGIADIPKTVQNITYNSMNLPKEIEEGEWKAEFIYNSDHRRVKMVIKQNDEEYLTRYYFSNKYELEGATAMIYERLYLGGDCYSAGSVFKTDVRSVGLYHIWRDNQGSVLGLFNSSNPANIVKEISYDPWGRLRNPSTYEIYKRGEEPELALGRGYGGHEHLPWFGLINMNARLYDPVVGRFLSPDPHVQLPDFTQNFNRYSYCLNNPLKYTDPDGEIVWFIPVIIGAVVGAYTGASIQSGTAAFWNWKGDAWKGAIAGGFIGAAAGGILAAGIGALGVEAPLFYAPSKAFGTTTVMMNSASINIGINAISGGGWDGAWKAGIVGAASGGWTATGGFSMVKAFGATNEFARLGGKLGYQMVGTAGSSIGNNWSVGRNPFSSVTLGAGPVNLTFGKGQKLLNWNNNLGNMVTTTLGMGNLAFGGKVSFDWKNLSLNYSGGVMDKAFKKYDGYGAYSVFAHSKELKAAYSHELHHLWQSRCMGDLFLLNYGMQGITSWIGDGYFNAFFEYLNYFEDQAYGEMWW